MNRAPNAFRVLHLNLYAWPVEQTIPSGTTRSQTVPISRENLAEVRQFRQANVAAAFARFLDRDNVGVFAVVDGRVVGHAWATLPRTRATRQPVHLFLRDGDSLIRYCHVAETHRGRGIFGDMLHALVERVSKEHPTRILIDTEASNIGSNRGIVRAGFQVVGRRTVLLVAGRPILEIRRPRGSESRRR